MDGVLIFHYCFREHKETGIYYDFGYVYFLETKDYKYNSQVLKTPDPQTRPSFEAFSGYHSANISNWFGQENIFKFFFELFFQFVYNAKLRDLNVQSGQIKKYSTYLLIPGARFGLYL